ncbi:hypothetical protein R3W88_024429 [Solanum pinnatisectum]|uniref:Uncharacterized protein n=1 Tax=Solanum pinnatisectum TaxID=50273 RepID=A0AAV9M0D7_9SOLN|nr:hypothetical protein R3W88_024429 [Solanum pinnatisectum]
MKLVQNKVAMRDIKQREALLRWVARYIAVEGVKVEWVRDMTLSIKKVSLSFF